MNLIVQIIMESETGQRSQQVARLERQTTCLENVGLTLAESKQLLAALQAQMVEEQISEYLDRHRRCDQCGEARTHKGAHDLTFQTLFGNLQLKSPRWKHCGCNPHDAKSFSPLAELLTEHVSPERLYLEAKWGSLIAFEPAANLLADTLPITETVNANTVRNHLHHVAQRAEDELGDEHGSFIEGCPRDWAELARPPAPITVGIDGGYVRQWEDKKAHFEVIVGKSIPEEGAACRFGFVQTYDEKPKRRLFEVLKGQGMQSNQLVTFLSDGGEDVREVQQYLSPESEHYLDWFHITMRITVMKQMAKGLPIGTGTVGGTANRPKMEEELQLLKWNVWHGNVSRALERIEELQLDLETADESENRPKLQRALREFETYIKNNRAFIPNFGERYRNQERISTAFVESTVNQVISKRMVKQQQMQWSKKGAHLLVQMRTKVLNNELEGLFRRWYPRFRIATNGGEEHTAAA
ncbi:MAG: ISKra4 family transposase [Bryobacterales bacterium]|nr:ISKra4 family transposase [Bryobacterales bacterium]